MRLAVRLVKRGVKIFWEYAAAPQERAGEIFSVADHLCNAGGSTGKQALSRCGSRGRAAARGMDVDLYLGGNPIDRVEARINLVQLSAAAARAEPALDTYMVVTLRLAG